MAHYHSIWSFSKLACLALTLSSSALIACKCETVCAGYADDTPRDQQQSNNDTGGDADNGNGSGDSIGPNPTAFYLDCEDLDPDKVYMQGYLERGNNSYQALIDVQEPEKLCVGFPSNGGALKVSREGRLLYRISSQLSEYPDTLYIMGQDRLTVNNRGRWVYPRSTDSNDERVATSWGRPFAVTTDEGTEYFSAVSSGMDIEILRSGDDEPYFELSGTHISESFSLIAALPGRELVVGHNQDGLIYIDSEFNETLIGAPDGAPETSHYNYRVSRTFTNEVTGHDSLWLTLTVADDDAEHRWSLDLEQLTVEYDGTFAPPPEHHYAGHPENVLDHDGSLIQLTYESHGDDDIYAVMKRPIASSGQATEILHSDADQPNRTWSMEEMPFVQVVLSSLVTGF